MLREGINWPQPGQPSFWEQPPRSGRSAVAPLTVSAGAGAGYTSEKVRYCER